jgi:hypothetical protein
MKPNINITSHRGPAQAQTLHCVPSTNRHCTQIALYSVRILCGHQKHNTEGNVRKEKGFYFALRIQNTL